MNYDEFVGQVQHRARLGTEGETVKAIRVTLEVLGERLFGEEAENLAAQLPSEIGQYLRQVDTSKSFDLDEFFKRVSQREGVDLPDANFHARAVMSVVKDAVTAGEFQDMRAQLPDEYDPLFEVETDA